ncbi:MAG: AI-2E family transporter, partial [Chitinophagaceae bacterium]
MNDNVNLISSKRVIEIVIVIVLALLLLDALNSVFHVFFGVLTFAIIFSVSFAKPYNKLCGLLKERRKLAAVIYTIILISFIAIPMIFLSSSIIHRIRELVLWIGEARKNGIPALPDWLITLPVVGTGVQDFWQQVQSDPQGIFISHEAQIRIFLQHLMTKGLGVIGVTFQLIIGIIISSVFLYNDQKLLQPIRNSVQHLFGSQSGLDLLDTSARAIRGVSVGVMGTAFIAAIFAWIGLVIGGIPLAAGLAALIFFLVVIQVGPLPVWIPLIIYTISKGYTGLTIFFIIWGAALLVIDAVVKPLLIGKSGGGIPFLALFIGVIGGVAAWGFTG